MLIKRPDDIKPVEITDRAMALRRREFLGGAAVAAAGLVLGLGCGEGGARAELHGEKIPSLVPGPRELSTDEGRRRTTTSTSSERTKRLPRGWRAACSAPSPGQSRSRARSRSRGASPSRT